MEGLLTRDYIYGLVPEYVWIYGYDPKDYNNKKKVTDGKYSRALRFGYNDSDDPQFKELERKKFCAKHLPRPPGPTLFH